MSWNTLILCLFGLSSCLIVSTAHSLQGEGIIEGEVPQDDQFLYQVAINSNEDTICGGAIIDDQYILTAAHCVIDNYGKFNGDPLTVIAGTKNLKEKDGKGVLIAVEKIYVSSDYDAIQTDTTGDIAVLKLKDSLNLARNTNLKKLKIAKDQQKTYAGERAKISGFGWDWIRINDVFGTSNKEEVGGSRRHLKYLNTNVLDSADCQKIFGDFRMILDGHVCAKAEQNHKRPSGICRGDSGGPLVYNDEIIIGVVSTSPFGCNESTKPAVYTRVSSYVDFIEKAKNDVESETVRRFIFTS